MSTDIEWERWGQCDPYYGVLTDPKFRSSALTAQSKQEFFDSGRIHVGYVLDMCRLYIDPAFSPKRVLEFGCGVGRLVIPFAEMAGEVTGVDVSPSMLAEAARNCNERGLDNVALVRSDETLSATSGQFDLVHSCIVLQHIDVPRGRNLFAQLVDRVQPGGIGALQVTFGLDLYASTFGQQPVVPPPPPAPPPDALARVKTRVKRLLQLLGIRQPPAAVQLLPPAPPPDPEMQMNFYSISELLFILQRAGVQRFHTDFTDHGGALGVFFFFQKPAPRS